jgi:small subunit ribosomal protein S2
MILDALCAAIKEGLEERKLEKDKEAAEEEATAVEEKPAGKTLRGRRASKPAKAEEEAAEKVAEEAPVAEPEKKEE